LDLTQVISTYKGPIVRYIMILVMYTYKVEHMVVRNISSHIVIWETFIANRIWNIM